MVPEGRVRGFSDAFQDGHAVWMISLGDRSCEWGALLMDWNRFPAVEHRSTSCRTIVR